MSKNFLTIKEAADILNVSRVTLRNWDKQGKLKALRHPFNNYRVYKSADIAKIVEQIETSDFVIRKKKDQIRKLSIKHLE